MKMTKVRRIILHHSAGESGNAAIFREEHKKILGATDVGYHWIIGNGKGLGNGELEVGRPSEQRGAHCKWNNSDSIGICVVGNFLTKFPSAEQYDTLIRVLTTECNRYGLDPMGFYKDTDKGIISGHKSWRATDCPGKIQELLERIRIDVKGRLAYKRMTD